MSDHCTAQFLVAHSNNHATTTGYIAGKSSRRVHGNKIVWHDRDSPEVCKNS